MIGFVRKIKTTSGAIAVQVCRTRGRKVEVLEHLGSAHTEEGVVKLEKKAREIITRGQRSLFRLEEFDGGRDPRNKSEDDGVSGV